MTDNLKKITEYLETEEGKAHMREYFGEIEAKNIDILEFFESDRFHYLLDRIKSWMVSNDIYLLTSEDYSYGESYNTKTGKNVPIPVSESEFYKLCGSFEKGLSSMEGTDSKMPFSNSFYEYEYWMVTYVYGQGTIVGLHLNKDMLRESRINKIIDNV